MTYLSNESGAVTVDWVVLTAGLVGLGLATMAVVSTGVQDASDDIQDELNEDHIIRSSFEYIPSFVSSGLMWANQSLGQCALVGGDQMICDPDTSEVGQTFGMSDGSTWTQTTTTIGNQDPTTVWTNGDGEIVAAEDVPEVPDNLPFAF